MDRHNESITRSFSMRLLARPDWRSLSLFVFCAVAWTAFMGIRVFGDGLPDSAQAWKGAAYSLPLYLIIMLFLIAATFAGTGKNKDHEDFLQASDWPDGRYD